MERTTAGSDSERQRSDRRRERDGGSSGGAGRGTVAALHGAVGNQAVQRDTDASDRSRTMPEDGASTAEAVERGATGSVVQRQTTVSRSAGPMATGANRDSTDGLCSRCAQRYRAGKSLDCPDCEAALGRSVDLASRNGAGGGVVQPKLAVNRPGDPAEREAERVAEEVVGTTDSDVVVSRRATGGGGGTVDDGTESQIRAATRGGRPLPEPVRSTFESRFDRDFSDVRVHTGPRGDAAARSIDAEAFTRGSDIVFARGNYRPNSAAGRQLLAHELTHVVQQGGASAGTGVSVHRQSAEQERKKTLSSPRFRGNETLEKVLRGEMTLGGSRTPSGTETEYALKLIQTALVEAGYGERVTGKYDIHTSAAVKQFQNDHVDTEYRLGAEPTIDAATMAALDERFPDPDQPTTSGAKNPEQTQWDPHNPTCLLDILCEWNDPLVEDFGDGTLSLVTFTEAYDRVWEADGEGWNESRQYIQGFLDGDVVGIERGVSCWEAAFILYQEWFHAQQSSSMDLKEREVEAWTAQEMWLLAQGLSPVRSEFRQTNSSSETIDTSEIHDHVVSEYDDIDGGRGDPEPGDVYPRTDQNGDPLPRVVTGQAHVVPSNWECPDES